jgi:hypothetical protein
MNVLVLQLLAVCMLVWYNIVCPRDAGNIRGRETQPFKEVGFMPTIPSSSLKVGDTAHNWTILTEPVYGDHSREGWHKFSICRCVCGTERRISTSNLAKGHTKSCGCLKAGLVSAAQKRHGATVSNDGKKTREYSIWRGMKTRCLNPNHSSYAKYGAKGITVCSRWIESFNAFLSDMGECPEGFSIDRIDNHGGYEPGNCRWANRTTQAQNRDTVKWLTFDGETLCISDWAKRFGVTDSAISYRLNRGWTVEKTLATPFDPKKGSKS